MGTKFHDILQPVPAPLSVIKGKTLAIDGMNMLFQVLHPPYQTQLAQQGKLPYGYYLDRTQRVVAHLYGWLQKAKHLMKAKCLPIVVFDGKPDVFKRLSRKDQLKSFRDIQTKFQTALGEGDLTTARNYALSKSFMFMNCVQESRVLLEMMGVPVIMAPTEAEAQCAALQAEGIADYVVTMDYDAVLFGASKVIRKLTFGRQKHGTSTVAPHVEVIDLPANLKRLGLTRTQLIDASILIGNDFFRGVPHLGPARAVAALQRHQSIQQMRQTHPSLFKDLPGWKYAKIHDLFSKAESISYEPGQIGARPFNRLGLEEILLGDHRLDPSKVAKKLDALERGHGQWYAQFRDLGAAFSRKNTTEGLRGPKPKHVLAPTLCYQREQFDVHLQRRLDRAKVKGRPPGGESCDFVAAAHLPDRLSKDAAPKAKSGHKKRSAGRIAAEFGVLKLRKSPPKE